MPLIQINTILSHWFIAILNRILSLPFQKQTLYALGHLSGKNLFWFTILPPSAQVIIGKCVVDILTIENAILLLEKSNLHYTRRITPKRVTSCGAHLRGLAPGLHSSEETPQRWRVVGDTVPI